MQAVTTIGLDIAKSIFQIHGVDAAGNVIVRRKLKRRYVLPFFQRLSPCLIGIEACASSHHWSRELQALGHTVRLMPPAPRLSARRSPGQTCGSPPDWIFWDTCCFGLSRCSWKALSAKPEPSA